MSRPAWFFDRDGVINVSPGPGYVLSWDAWEWMPGIVELLKEIKLQGYFTAVVTSQRGVGKGLMTRADLDDIHGRMQSFLGEHGVAFDAIYAYTATPDCPYQPKPDPLMIRKATEEHDLDLTRSWLIGDMDRDIEMGRSAGVAKTIRVHGDKSIGIEADYTVQSLEEALALVRSSVA